MMMCVYRKAALPNYMYHVSYSYFGISVYLSLYVCKVLEYHDSRPKGVISHIEILACDPHRQMPNRLLFFEHTPTTNQSFNQQFVPFINILADDAS